MPRRPPTACTWPGCPRTATDRGRCEVHPNLSWNGGRAMPPGWARTRAAILRRDPVCRLCHLAPSTQVHHARPPSEDPADLLGVCEPCHRRVTQAQAAEARRLAR